MRSEEASRSGPGDDEMSALLRGSVRRARLSCVIVDGGSPRLATGLIARPRLAEALDLMLPVTVLRAPRGFGKTTLAARWLTSLGESQVIPAWISVDSDSSDSEAFWRLLAQRLASATDLPESDLAGRADPRRRVRALLEHPGPPIVLVVDEADWLASTDVQDLVGLVRRFSRLHLIASMRADRLDRASWLDLDGQVLGPEDLAFDAVESAEVLRGLDALVGDEEVDRLQSELGGWPLAVRAFALARRASRADLEQTLATVRAQLGATILALVPEWPASDLVLASVLVEDFTIDELAVLLAHGDRSDLGAEVEALLTRGLLATGTDSGERRHRWAGMIRTVLLTEVERLESARVVEMHRRLARRYIELDRDDRAMAHAVLAQDWQQLREHLEQRATRILAYHWDALREAMVATPRDAFEGSIVALSTREFHFGDRDGAQAVVACLPAGPEEIARWVRSAEPLVRYDELMSVLAMFRFHGDIGGALEVVDRVPEIIRAMQEAHPDDLVSPGAAVSLQCALVWLHAGDLGRAAAEMERSHRYGAHSLVGFVLRDSAAKLALIHALEGDHKQTGAWIARAQAHHAPEIWATPFIEASLAGAKVLEAVARLDRRAATRDAADLAILHPRDELWAALMHARSRVALLWGHPSAALRELGTAETERIPAPSPFFDDILTADRADLMMRAGLGSSCAVLLDGRPQPGPAIQVAQARLALLSGDLVAAVECARAALEHENARAATDLEALLVSAVAEHRAGRSIGAAEHLRAAVTTGHGRRDAFALVPQADLHAIARAVPEAEEILTDPRLVALGEVFPESLTIISLTRRERVVLRHLAAGMTLQAIAFRETLSINTIKSQVRSLYRKLGAPDRAHALAVAVKEGLV